MRTILTGVFLLGALPIFAASPIPGEVSCNKGVDIAKVQALVKRTVLALKKDQATVIQQINHGDKQWKDGDYYMVVFDGTKVLAHGYWPSLAGQDVGTTTYQNTFPWIKAGQRLTMERGEGCLQYRFHNPAKHGLVEDKIGYSVKVNDTIWAVSGTYLVK